MEISLVLPAGGSSTRFGNTPKLLQKLGDVTVFESTLKAFQTVSQIKEVIIPVQGDLEEEFKALARPFEIFWRVQFVPGGATRQESVQNGVYASFGYDYVLVHDAARPFVSVSLIDRILSKVRDDSECEVCIPVLPVTDTIKRVDGNIVLETMDRSELVAVQTPQLFRRELLLDAYSSLSSERFSKCTDEAMVMEAMNIAVQTVTGDLRNKKITFPQDLFQDFSAQKTI